MKNGWIVDQPLCFVDAEDNKFWRANGQLHRLDGPAVEYIDGSKEWYQHGVLHRTDGPALEYANGDKAYWVEGKNFTEQEFEVQCKING